MNLPRNGLGPQKVEASELAGDFKGRMKVSNPAILLDAKFNEDTRPFSWNELTTGSGSTSYDSNASTVELSVSSTQGDKVIRQSNEYVPYQSAKVQNINLTGVFGPATSGIRKEMGYHDDLNGVFFRQKKSGELEIVVRSNTSGTVSETRYAQSNWNRDTLDGSDDTNNPSGIQLDVSKANLLAIDFLWLGVGGVRFGVFIDGRFIWVHREDVGNALTEPWSGNPSLPVRYIIENVDGSTSSDSMTQICASVLSEGGKENVSGVNRTVFTDLDNATTIGTTQTNLLAVRPKSTFAGRPNRTMLIPIVSNIAIEAELIAWKLLYDVDIDETNTTWNSVGPDSAAEFSRDVTTTGGGINLANGFLSSNGKNSAGDTANQLNTRLVVARGIDHTIDANADNIVLTAQALTRSTTGFGSMTWRER